MSPIADARRGPGAWTIFRRNRAAVAGAATVLALLVLAVAGPLSTPFTPDQVGAGPSMAAPGLAHPFGTDELGRDVWARAANGLRISLMVGFGAAAIATAIGTVVGGVAGFAGGRLDDALMRLTETFQVIPRFFLAVMLVAFFGAGIGNIVLSIAVLGWPELARLVRAEFLALRGRQFIDAARVAGASAPTLVFSEILPNAMGPVVVNTSLLVGQAMLLEAGLSYLGLGDPASVSLGVMLHEAQQLMRSAWWTTAFPGLLLFLAVLGLNLAGDGLNDVLNPRSRER